jgi:hypothetical protein
MRVLLPVSESGQCLEGVLQLVTEAGNCLQGVLQPVSEAGHYSYLLVRQVFHYILNTLPVLTCRW